MLVFSNVEGEDEAQNFLKHPYLNLELTPNWVAA